MKKLVGAAPWIFILIWSSGFVVAKYGFEDADSLFFLAIRLLLAAVILFVLTAALRQPLTLSRTDLRASLEWATSCPPPRHNFTSMPRIRSERPAFDLHHPHIKTEGH